MSDARAARRSAERGAELERVEVADARPERDVRVGRLLRLQPDEPLDPLERGPVLALQEPLAPQERAVEGARG